jgi:hypothetical protein
MTIQLDLLPAAEARLREEAAAAGQEPSEYASVLMERQLMRSALEALKDRPRPKSISELKPRIPSPPGTSWLAQVVGQWPGDETDEEIHRALEELS